MLERMVGGRPDLDQAEGRGSQLAGQEETFSMAIDGCSWTSDQRGLERGTALPLLPASEPIAERKPLHDFRSAESD